MRRQRHLQLSEHTSKYLIINLTTRIELKVNSLMAVSPSWRAPARHSALAEEHSALTRGGTNAAPADVGIGLSGLFAVIQ